MGSLLSETLEALAGLGAASGPEKSPKQLMQYFQLQCKISVLLPMLRGILEVGVTK